MRERERERHVYTYIYTYIYVYIYIYMYIHMCVYSQLIGNGSTCEPKVSSPWYLWRPRQLLWNSYGCHANPKTSSGHACFHGSKRSRHVPPALGRIVSTHPELLKGDQAVWMQRVGTCECWIDTPSLLIRKNFLHSSCSERTPKLPNQRLRQMHQNLTLSCTWTPSCQPACQTSQCPSKCCASSRLCQSSFKNLRLYFKSRRLLDKSTYLRLCVQVIISSRFPIEMHRFPRRLGFSQNSLN